MSSHSKFRIDPELKEWAEKLVKAMGNYKCEGAVFLGIDNDVRLWYRNLTDGKLNCEILKFYKKYE